MSIPLLILLIVLVIVTFVFLRTKAGLVLAIIALLILIAIGSGLVPTVLLQKLQSSFKYPSTHSWREKNVIIVLGGGAIKLPNGNDSNISMIAYPRIVEAAQLYFECTNSHKTCQILISGGDVLNLGKAESLIYRDRLKDLGVKQADILPETQSLNTYDNARLLKPILDHLQYDQVMLVTSGVHMRRALLYFAHFGIRPTPVLADYEVAKLKVLPDSNNFLLTDMALHEYIGIVRYYLYNTLGWNQPSPKMLVVPQQFSSSHPVAQSQLW